MKSALIGHTGLVGSNLLRQTAFDDLYNSRNIESIAGKRYSLLVCAGAPAQKWRANQDPAADRVSIERLMRGLERVRADFAILISTVDVFPDPCDVDEDTPIHAAEQHAYGKHRYQLEQFVAGRFPSLIVRLPGLFGEGLKKNIVYDFLHNNALERIHLDATYQFYSLAWLWSDLERVKKLGVKLIHLATQPMTVSHLVAEAFGWQFTNRPSGAVPHYDLRSKYAGALGGIGGYLYSRLKVMAALREFVHSHRSTQGAPRDFQPGLAA